MATERPSIAAVVDIGSNVMRLKVAQPRGNEPEEVDIAEFPINFGDETFTKGSISFETGAETAAALANMIALVSQYGVEAENIRITATTALREAKNSQYVKDRMELSCGLPISILSDVDEKSLIFCELLRRLHAQKYPMNTTFMMAYIGTASVGVAIVKEGSIVYYRNVKAGTLTMLQMLNEIEKHLERGYLVLEDYLNSQLFELRQQIKAYRPKGLVVCGKEFDTIARLVLQRAPERKEELHKTAARKLYDAIKSLTPEQIAYKYNLTSDGGGALLSSLAIYLALAECTSSEDFLYCDSTTSDALLYEILYPKQGKSWRKSYEKSTIASAWASAKRMGCDVPHCAAVEGYALEIFDGIRKLHGFSHREKLYLQVAAILHDCGKFNNMKNHNISSYHLILDHNLIGLSLEEQRLTACIARYHNTETPSESDDAYGSLNAADRLTVSKLSAILRLAEALDGAHQKKIKGITAERAENKLIIHAVSGKDTSLEEWSFRHRAAFFSDVFGISCELSVQRGD